MIPILIWRCPYCHENDTLIQDKGLFKPWRLECSNCHTQWQVKRVMGEDYRLTVIACPVDSKEVGLVLPLAEWYARMKSTLELTPIESSAFTLDVDEHLYLASKVVELLAIANDPLFFPDYEEPNDGESPLAKVVGKGRIFLTNQRFIWLDDSGFQFDFPLEKVNSAYTIFNAGIVLMYQTSLYIFKYEQESLLKWVTYFGLIAPLVKETTGHVITTSNY